MCEPIYSLEVGARSDFSRVMPSLKGGYWYQLAHLIKPIPALILPLFYFVMTHKANILQVFFVECYIWIVYIVWCQPYFMMHNIPGHNMTSLTHSPVNCYPIANICLSAF